LGVIQTIIVILIFAAAVAYVTRLLIRSFRSADGCETGCGKCGAIDVNAIEKKLKEKGL
jgi:hypothetical protein